MAAVRGIGVAVITNTSGTVPSRFFSRSAARCSTPNRCCSSMTTAPREANSTPSWIRAWVPIDTSTVPSARPSTIRRRSPAVVRLVKRATWRGRVPSSVDGSGTVIPSSSSATPRWCWSANTSVGAMNAPWWPPCTAVSSTATATTVLPDPTSPWRSRCIGAGRAMSSSISAMTRR